MKICAFFGRHIAGNQDKYIAEILRILNETIGEERAEILFGDIEGIIPTALLACCIYRSTHPNTKLAFVSISNDIPEYFRKVFNAIYYSSFEDETQDYAIMYRNNFIVDNCDVYITCCCESDNIANDLYLRAQKSNKTIYNLYNDVM